MRIAQIIMHRLAFLPIPSRFDERFMKYPNFPVIPQNRNDFSYYAFWITELIVILKVIMIDPDLINPNGTASTP